MSHYRKKLTVIVSHPIQYHAVLWRSLDNVENVDFEVLFCSDHGQNESLDKDFGVSFKWDVPLKAGYKSYTYKNYGFGNGFFKYINPGILKAILFNKSDIVYFHGVNNLTAFSSFWLTKLRGSKTIIRNIAHLLDKQSNRKIKLLLKDLVYGSIFRKANVCLFIGENNKNFYKKFRINENRLVHAPHVVDNVFFQKGILTDEAKNEFKKKLKIEDDSIIILFCGKLISKKQPCMLLDAFINSNLNRKATLLFVGDGVLKNEITRKAESLNEHAKSVRLLGFQNQSKLPSIYSIADILVLPSFHQETWGLVVNEVLNFSSSIIVSDNVGCGPELVQGKTGYIFDRNSEEELQNALENLVNSDIIREKFKENASQVIKNWSIKEYIESLKKIINE